MLRDQKTIPNIVEGVREVFEVDPRARKKERTEARKGANMCEKLQSDIQTRVTHGAP